MEKEIYKVFTNKKVLYEISNYGHVKRNGLELELKDNNGYLRFYRGCPVHRAVAELFIDNPNNYSDVDHIDGNKHNNHYTNLRWCSRSQNIMNPNTHNKWLEKQRSNNTSNKKRISRLKYLSNNDIAVTGWKWLTDGINEILLDPQYWGEYIDIGYRFGRKPREVRENITINGF